ncbi:MAG: MmgE/PrpD family protein [Actinomycetota bacterium]|nr:MmgE/PrpD family protein [Actinomycetota bacterium]
MTLSEQLAGFAASTTYGSLPEAVRASVRRRVLDIVGVSLGALPLDTSRAVIEHVLSQGGAPQSRAIGVSSRMPATQAAFVGGVLAHSLDYDDTHLPSIVHPSASVVPASMAAAQLGGAPGSELVRAIAIGLEVCVRLGMAGYDETARNSEFFERGQHATSICGTLASAAAASVLLGGGTDEIGHAMAIAASMASGVIEANRGGGTVKRLHCGWAAHAALNAAELASRGITGPPTILEGRFGFFRAFLGETFDAEVVVRGLGADWEVPGIFFKPYPANHFTHTAIDAAIALRERGVHADDVEDATLRVASATVRTIGEPIERKRAPETGYEAQFSGPYAVAAGLVGGGGLGLSLDDFTDALALDQRRRALAARVSVFGDPECDAVYPYQFPAVLTVRMTDGSTLEERVMANRGGPQRPLSDDELATKFRDNARRSVTDDVAAEIEDAAKRLDVIEDVEDLVRPTAKE